MKYSVGVDIGGTKIATAILDEEGTILGRVQVPTNKETSETLFKQMIFCIENSLTKVNFSISDICGIGIGVPGKVDCEKGTAIFQNNLPWKDFPLVQKVKDYFKIENVIIDNDVYMSCFAEWRESNKKTRKTFVYLTISTGISCCIIHQDQFIRGTGFAGEVGFLPINDDSLNDIQRLEEIASGPGIEKTAIKSGVKNYTTADIVEGYQQGEIIPTKIMNNVIGYYTKAIYSISCILDPDCFVLGGGIINHNPYLISEIKNCLNHYLVEEQKDVINRLRVSKCSNDAGLVGAGVRGMND